MLSKKNSKFYVDSFFGGSLFDEMDELFGNQTIVANKEEVD